MLDYSKESVDRLLQINTNYVELHKDVENLKAEAQIYGASFEHSDSMYNGLNSRMDQIDLKIEHTEELISNLRTIHQAEAKKSWSLIAMVITALVGYILKEIFI